MGRTGGVRHLEARVQQLIDVANHAERRSCHFREKLGLGRYHLRKRMSAELRQSQL